MLPAPADFIATVPVLSAPTVNSFIILVAADTVKLAEIVVFAEIVSGLSMLVVSATVSFLKVVPPETSNPVVLAFRVRLLKVVADIFLTPVMLPVIVTSPLTLSACRKALLYLELSPPNATPGLCCGS